MSENKTNERLIESEYRLTVTFKSGSIAKAEKVGGRWCIGGVPVEGCMLSWLLESIWKQDEIKVSRTVVTTVERTEELP